MKTSIHDIIPAWLPYKHEYLVEYVRLESANLTAEQRHIRAAAESLKAMADNLEEVARSYLSAAYYLEDNGSDAV